MVKIKSFIYNILSIYSVGAISIPVCLTIVALKDGPKFGKHTPKDIGFCLLVNLGYGLFWPILIFENIK